MSKKKFGLVLVFVFILATSLSAQYTLLHLFSVAATDGAHPEGSLILDGSTLYGMTSHGGTYNYGTIFKINTDGTGGVLLHSFASGTSDGREPYGSLILSGSTLYGMTCFGGMSNADYPYGMGTIFKIKTDGTEFTLLYSFAGASDGANPGGSLILIGSTLYGMTSGGGASSLGTIFKINTDGTGFGLLHSFAGGASDGAEPSGSLILIGSTLYGMTFYGGTTYRGTIFMINEDGSGYTLLHLFAGGSSDGANPIGSLILIGSTFYGITPHGGTDNYGTIFKINTDGTGGVLLHSFAGGTSDGKIPKGSLILIGSTLYGTTYEGGTTDWGTIFEIKTDGTGFGLLHSFEGGGSDGKYPYYGSLILSDSKLCGMTGFGGASDFGVIFSYQLPAADIAVTKSSDNLAPWQGAQFNFTVTAKNNGPGDASGLQVTDKLPTGLTFVSSTPSTGAYSSSTGIWDIGLLANGATATLTLRATASGSGTVTNTASVSALNNDDPVTFNNSASQAVTISIPCTITTNYTGVGLKVTVDGTAYTLPQTYYWAPGTSYTLSVSSPQSGAAGTRYVYYSWSDSGAQTHSITVPASAKTYTVYFSKQYSLTTIDNPLAGGTITPAGTTWYTFSKNATIGQSVVVQATSKAGYVFTGWSGSLTGGTNPATVVMNGPMSITGNFASGKTLIAPVLVQPANGATGQPLSVTLTWQDKNSSPQELHYKVRIKRGAGAYKNYTLAANTVSYVASGLVAGKTYSWNVQALGNGTTIKNSSWANGAVDFKFTTK